jgi:hypothetical protein
MRCVKLFRSVAVGTAGIALTMAIGCGNSSNDTTINDALPIIDDVELPSQEEFDARAAEEISPENADEAFRELEREILDDDEP